jgi:hypothetical protein
LNIIKGSPDSKEKDNRAKTEKRNRKRRKQSTKTQTPLSHDFISADQFGFALCITRANSLLKVAKHFSTWGVFKAENPGISLMPNTPTHQDYDVYGKGDS